MVVFYVLMCSCHSHWWVQHHPSQSNVTHQTFHGRQHPFKLHVSSKISKVTGFQWWIVTFNWGLVNCPYLRLGLVLTFHWKLTTSLLFLTYSLFCITPSIILIRSCSVCPLIYSNDLSLLYPPLQLLAWLGVCGICVSSRAFSRTIRNLWTDETSIIHAFGF